MIRRILLAGVLLCPLAGWSQGIKPIDAKPGLWETTTTTELSGSPMAALSDEQLAKIPPEQRARIEESMKKSGMGAPKTATNKYCVTREQLSKSFFDNGDKNCTTKLVSSSSSSQQIHIECTPNNIKMVGDVNLERVDSEHVKGSATMKISGDSSAGGRGMSSKMTFNAKFVSSDCGSVKPNDAK